MARQRTDSLPALPSASSFNKNIIPLLGIVLVTFLAFSPTLKNLFVDWDDPQTLLANYNYRGLDLKHLKWMFTTRRMGHYIPITWMTLGLDFRLWGMEPYGYHLGSLLWHCLNAVLYYFLAKRIFERSMPHVAALQASMIPWAAGFSALLFSIHPLRVESVAWATERRDVVSGAFFLLTLLAYLKAKSSEMTSRGSAGWLISSVAFYLLSLLSKVSGLGMVLILIIVDWYPLKRLGGEKPWFGAETRRVWLEKIPFAVLAGVFAKIAFAAQLRGHFTYSLNDLVFGERVAIVFYAITFYLRKTLMPWGLSPMYEIPQVFQWFAPTYLLCMGLVLALTAWFCFRARRWPAGLALWAGYLVLLAPTSGIVQSGPQIAADRYSYFSCMGWPLLAGAGWLILWRRTSETRGSGFSRLCLNGGSWLIVGVLGMLTSRQVSIWHDTKALWTHALKINPMSSMAHTSLGGVYLREGDVATAKILLTRALELEPLSDDANYMMGKLAMNEKRIPEALAYDKKALEINPDYVSAHIDYGLMCMNQGNYPEAIEHFNRAIEEDPESAEAYVNRGVVYAMQNKLPEAIAQFDYALQIDPTFQPAKTNLLRALSLTQKH